MKTPDRWQEIDALFARTLDGSPDERAAFLDDACDDEAVRRFAQERQILASLHHLNTTRLCDGGVTEGGFPTS